MLNSPGTSRQRIIVAHVADAIGQPDAAQAVYKAVATRHRTAQKIGQREAALWCLGLDFAACAAAAIIVVHVPAVLALRLATAHCICATTEFAADTTGCTAIAMEVPAVLTLRPITVKFATHAVFASGLRCRNCED